MSHAKLTSSKSGMIGGTKEACRPTRPGSRWLGASESFTLDCCVPLSPGFSVIFISSVSWVELTSSADTQRSQFLTWYAINQWSITAQYEHGFPLSTPILRCTKLNVSDADTTTRVKYCEKVNPETKISTNMSKEVDKQKTEKWNRIFILAKITGIIYERIKICKISQ